MKVLVACEESQAVTKAFRSQGHEAYSCDLLPCSGGHPEWHIKQDIRIVLCGGAFVLGNDHKIDEVIIHDWDLMIAHPPCTYLCNSGVRWLKGNPERYEKMIEAKELFWLLYKQGSRFPVAIENPIPHKHAMLPKYNQIIQPWQFGHMETKQTCLWLINLPALQPTNIVYSEMMKLPYGERAKVHHASPGPERAKIRSKTYTGIAEAMAFQWGSTKQAIEPTNQ